MSRSDLEMLLGEPDRINFDTQEGFELWDYQREGMDIRVSFRGVGVVRWRDQKSGRTCLCWDLHGRYTGCRP